MTDGNFSRLLRNELGEHEKNKILKAIEELMEERKEWNKKKSYIQKKM